MTRLRAERTRRGWTQLDLAAITRIHPSDISRIERGRLRPYPAQLARLAQAYGVSDPQSLMGDVSATDLTAA